jgi:hypothetical protein
VAQEQAWEAQLALHNESTRAALAAQSTIISKLTDQMSAMQAILGHVTGMAPVANQTPSGSNEGGSNTPPRTPPTTSSPAPMGPPAIPSMDHMTFPPIKPKIKYKCQTLTFEEQFNFPPLRNHNHRRP